MLKRTPKWRNLTPKFWQCWPMATIVTRQNCAESKNAFKLYSWTKIDIRAESYIRFREFFLLLFFLNRFRIFSSNWSASKRNLPHNLYLVIYEHLWADLLDIQASQQVAKPFYETKVQPSTLIPKQVGNMYTASIYAAFASLIHNKNSTLVKLLTPCFRFSHLLVTVCTY